MVLNDKLQPVKILMTVPFGQIIITDDEVNFGSWVIFINLLILRRLQRSHNN